MSVLLTEEELILLLRDNDNSNYIVTVGDTAISKAQLKKVVEWLGKRYEYSDASIRGGSLGFFISEKEWQALKKEAGPD